ncbi:MAG: putative quinol monooxygenase [Gammaproteobacteria bacterium]|nr:putative quinol monooxygenase [Gammaproteobacteria bacterium]
MREQVIVRFEVREGNVDEARDAIEAYVSAVEANEPGTVFYASYQARDNPNVFASFMIFRDADAHRAHTGTEHVEAFVAKLYPLCVTTPQPIYLTELVSCGTLSKALEDLAPA